jgi:uncharacterized protein YndB with AHSA1/START domain
MSTPKPIANSNAIPSDPIIKSIRVVAPIEIAFDVFARNMSSWWDLEGHHIGAAKAVEAVVEPRAGGRWYEKGEDGSECDWGRVLAYEPPTRLLLTWQISAAWAFDAGLHTEVEVTFERDGDGATRVTLEHRGLEQYGPAEATIREILGSPAGWPGTLDAFGRAAEKQPQVE